MKLYPLLFLISFTCFAQTNTSFAQKRNSIVQNGLNSYFKGDTIGLLNANKELKKIYKKTKDSLSLAKIYHFKALVYRIKFRLDSSYYYYHQSKNISILLKDSLEVGRRLLSMANMQNDERDYVGAEITIIEGLKYLEPLKEYTFTPHSLVTLGNVLTSLSRFEEARKYYRKAAELYIKNSSKELNEREQLNVLNNLGNTYLLESNPKEALKYLKQGLQHNRIETKFLWHYKRLLGNAGESKYLLDQKEEAWNDLRLLLKVREETNDIYGLSLSCPEIWLQVKIEFMLFLNIPYSVFYSLKINVILFHCIN